MLLEYGEDIFQLEGVMSKITSSLGQSTRKSVKYNHMRPGNWNLVCGTILTNILQLVLYHVLPVTASSLIPEGKESLVFPSTRNSNYTVFTNVCLKPMLCAEIILWPHLVLL